MPSGSVSLANSRLSLVNGTAFVDFSAAGTLNYLNGKLTIEDSAHKKIVGYIKSAGTGETLGDEILTSWTNNGYETFTLDGTDIDQAVETGTAGRCYGNTATLSGGLFKYVVGTYTKASGANPHLIIGAQTNALGTTIYPIVNGSDSVGVLSGATTKYVTQSAGTFFGIRSLAAGDFAATGLSVAQVTAPSATGATITSTRGGTTYNWESVEVGFNYNDSAGYTYTIALAKRSFNFGFCWDF